MSEFKRENRYWVLKLSDVEHLYYKEQNKLIRLCNIVKSSRLERGKPKLECVVVESDWPIYEQVWDMVQRLAEGREQEIDALKRKVEFLSQRADQLNSGRDYLMTVSPDDLTVEDALEAFGFSVTGTRLA